MQENTEDCPNLGFLSPAAVGAPSAGDQPVLVNPTRSQPETAEQAQRWADRYALGRVESIGSELQDISEVEYREVRLEKVILVGIFAADRDEAELSLQELAALAKTAGAVVLAGLLQRREKPLSLIHI